jgi:hypothetical protein
MVLHVSSEQTPLETNQSASNSNLYGYEMRMKRPGPLIAEEEPLSLLGFGPWTIQPVTSFSTDYAIMNTK